MSYDDDNEDGYGAGYDAGYESDYAGLGDLGYGYEGQAIVTTADPSPAGDLKIHAAANASSQQVGGADKGGVVEVTGSTTDPAWVLVNWPGSARYPACSGFAAAAYLVPASAPPAPAPIIPPAPPPPAPDLPVHPAVYVPPDTTDNTVVYVALGVAAAALAAWLLLRKKKRT